MQHHTHVGRLRPAREAVQAPSFERILSLIAALRHRWRLRRTIETLRALDDRTLADIGLCRGEIEDVVRARIRHR